MNLSVENYTDLYYKLVLCRETDDRVRSLIGSGLLTGLFHLGAGQEAMPVAVGSLLRKEDFLKVDYRGVASAIAKGVPLKAVLASFFNRRRENGDPFQGYWFAPKYGLLGVSNSLGEDIAVYVGAALSAKTRGTDQITVCFFGDGTANRGPVHESLNMAALWKLPIVFICENNEYGLSCHVRNSTAGQNIAARGAGYGITGKVVDGNDVLECYEAASEAIELARREGPSLIEARTYRIRGHWEGDPEPYRIRTEVEEWRRRDPLPRFRKALNDMGALSADSAAELEARAKAEVAKTIEEVLTLPWLEIEDYTSGQPIE